MFLASLTSADLFCASNGQFFYVKQKVEDIFSATQNVTAQAGNQTHNFWIESPWLYELAFTTNVWKICENCLSYKKYLKANQTKNDKKT